MKAAIVHLFWPTREAPATLLAGLLFVWSFAYWFIRRETHADAIALLLPTLGSVRIALLLIVKLCRGRRWDIPKRKTIV